MNVPIRRSMNKYEARYASALQALRRDGITPILRPTGLGFDTPVDLPEDELKKRSEIQLLAQYYEKLLSARPDRLLFWTRGMDRFGFDLLWTGIEAGTWEVRLRDRRVQSVADWLRDGEVVRIRSTSADADG